MTALHDIVSRIEEQIVFDPSLRTVEATYKRRINNGERLSVVKYAYLPIYPLHVTVSGIGDSKQDENRTIAIFWVLVENMKWDNGEVFEPQYGDTFSYAGQENHQYSVMDFSCETITVRDSHAGEEKYAVVRIQATEEA